MDPKRREYSIHSVCRTCLAALENVMAYDLFLIPGLAKKLCICTSLSVESQDGFPKNICINCFTKLNDLNEFQKMCVDSVQKFQEMVASQAFSVGGPDLDVPPDDPEEDINFDPLLHSKVETMDNEEEVIKMLEKVDKEPEDKEEYDAFADEDDDQDDDFAADSGNDYHHDDDDDDHDSSDDDLPLAQRSKRSKKDIKMPKKVTQKPSKKKPTEKGGEEEEEDVDNASSTDTESNNVTAKVKPKRKRIPADERHLHRLIDCHICHQKFKKASCYEEHMKHHNDLLPYQCTVESCLKGFTTANGLKVHIEHAHTEESKMQRCTVEGCNRTFARLSLLNVHLKRTHKLKLPPREFPCSDCDKIFRCQTALKKHMYKHTGRELPFACEICGKRFPINSALRDHLLRHAGIKNHVCPYCGVGKTTRQEWNNHILTHTKEKKFQCQLCDHASTNKQALSNHVKVVHMKRKDFACQYCGKTFGKSFSCKVHERSHTGEKTSECKICGKIFLQEKSLTKHLKTHEKRELPKTQPADAASDETTPPAQPEPKKKAHNSGRVERVDISQLAGTAINPITSVSLPSWSPAQSGDSFSKKEGQHICPDCGKGFNHIGNMKLHYKVVHLKVKDFCCRFCPKRFAKKHYLREHEYIHTGERPYVCKVCGNSFRQECVLKIHMKVHNRPPKPPKQPAKPKSNKPKSENPPNKRQPPFEQFQDPAAERAAASAELLAYQIEENESKRKAELEQRKIQEAAVEQLSKLELLQAPANTYSSLYAQKSAEERTTVDALKLDHV